MAHNVVIKKVPKLAKDGHLLKGKYVYRVACKHRMCRGSSLGEATSAAQADYLKSEHHLGVSFEHSANHPSDKAHERVQHNKQKKAGTRGNS